MGSLVGHVAPGIGFLVIGLWHLFNHIKLFCLYPTTYTAFPWFPTPKLRHMELFLLLLGSSLFISLELFIFPRLHHPFDPKDGTIPSNHLHNFEHSFISLTIFMHAAFAIIFDKARPRAHNDLTFLVGSVVFAQEIFLFHFHSTDHMGVEGQYHLLLQPVLFVSLATTLMSIPMRKSFFVSFVRSLSIAFQGIWLIIMGYMLYTPNLIAKGCSIHHGDGGHQMVTCSSDEALHRAKSLVNILFSWFLVGMTTFVMLFYLFLEKNYSEKIKYSKLNVEELEEINTMMVEYHDLKPQKGGKQHDESTV